MPKTGDGRVQIVLFLDDVGWNSFDQVAAILKRKGLRTVRLTTSQALHSSRLFTDLNLRRLADRLFYDELIKLSTAEGRERLYAVLNSGNVIDVVATEPALVILGLDSPLTRALTRRSLAFHGTPPAVMLDKFAVNDALKRAGVDTPTQIAVRDISPAKAARRLGLPIVLKHPIGASGDHVRIAHSIPEIETCLQDLGGEAEPVFYQEHVPGKVVVYGAVVGDDGPLIEHAFRIERTQYACGPAALTTLYDHPAAMAAGRRALEIFAPLGFASFGFIEAEDGRFLHIDANIRPWGMIAAPLPLGIDFAGVYAAMTSKAAWQPRQRRPDANERLPVFPHAVYEAAMHGSPLTALARAVEFVRACSAAIGPVYCAHTLSRALLLAGRRIRSASQRRDPAKGASGAAPPPALMKIDPRDLDDPGVAEQPIQAATTQLTS